MKSHYLFAALLGLAVCFTSCNESAIYPGDNSYNQTSIIVAPPMPDPIGADIPEGAITVDSARAICASLASGTVSDSVYYVKGWICGQDASKNAEAIEKYGNVYFYMGVSKLSETKHALYAFQVYGLNGKPVRHTDAIKVGDFVVIKCHLTNYNGVYETKGQGDGYIYSSTNPDITKRPDAIEVTCAEAKAIAMALSANNTPTEEYYCVTGYITNVAGSPSKGQQTFWMNDTTGTTKTLQAYWANLPDSVTTFTIGQHVKLYGHIMKYNTTAEVKNGDVEIIVDEK